MYYRNILSETGGTTAGSVPIQSFDYANKAARLLSAQDIKKACGVTVGRYVTKELQNCVWLFENIGQFDGPDGALTFGYWLETPFSYTKVTVCNIDGSDLSVGFGARASSNNFTGIRPVITVRN